MIGLKRGTVELQEHSSEWDENARQTILELSRIFGDKAADIQHVGSTSVRGLKAKPIVDIAVGVESFNDVLRLIPELKRCGFIHGNMNDSEEQVFFSCGDFENDIRTHHIHVVLYGGEEWNHYIKFRDTLRQDSEIREAYERLKLELAKKYPDNRETYTESKSDFIQRVLNREITCRERMITAMKDTVLLVVDVQTALIESHPYQEEKILKNIGQLLAQCRKSGIEVIYVRHDSGEDDELKYGSEGWQVEHRVEPAAGERIFDKKFNSAFRQTGLKEYLDKKGVKNIILVGLQAEYCIDATCKVAFEYGYQVYVPRDCIFTFDTPSFSAKSLLDFYVNDIWKDRFAKVLSIEELEQEILKY